MEDSTYPNNDPNNDPPFKLELEINKLPVCVYLYGCMENLQDAQLCFIPGVAVAAKDEGRQALPVLAGMYKAIKTHSNILSARPFILAGVDVPFGQVIGGTMAYTLSLLGVRSYEGISLKTLAGFYNEVCKQLKTKLNIARKYIYITHSSYHAIAAAMTSADPSLASAVVSITPLRFSNIKDLFSNARRLFPSYWVDIRGDKQISKTASVGSEAFSFLDVTPFSHHWPSVDLFRGVKVPLEDEILADDRNTQYIGKMVNDLYLYFGCKYYVAQLNQNIMPYDEFMWRLKLSPKLLLSPPSLINPEVISDYDFFKQLCEKIIIAKEIFYDSMLVNNSFIIPPPQLLNEQMKKYNFFSAISDWNEFISLNTATEKERNLSLVHEESYRKRWYFESKMHGLGIDLADSATITFDKFMQMLFVPNLMAATPTEEVISNINCLWDAKFAREMMEQWFGYIFPQWGGITNVHPQVKEIRISGLLDFIAPRSLGHEPPRPNLEVYISERMGHYIEENSVWQKFDKILVELYDQGIYGQSIYNQDINKGCDTASGLVGPVKPEPVYPDSPSSSYTYAYPFSPDSQSAEAPSSYDYDGIESLPGIEHRREDDMDLDPIGELPGSEFKNNPDGRHINKPSENLNNENSFAFFSASSSGGIKDSRYERDVKQENASLQGQGYRNY